MRLIRLVVNWVLVWPMLSAFMVLAVIGTKDLRMAILSVVDRDPPHWMTGKEWIWD